MKKPELKREIVTYGEEACNILKYVAEGMSCSQTPVSTDFLIDFSKLRKLKISLEKEDGLIYLKCKVKYFDSDDVPSEKGLEIHLEKYLPDYKTLKKRMDKRFKSIGERLKQGGLPSNVEAELFCSNAELMTSFPGRGDAMYQDFLDCIRDFRESFHNTDLERCKSSFAKLSAMKKSCHHAK